MGLGARGVPGDHSWIVHLPRYATASRDEENETVLKNKHLVQIWMHHVPTKWRYMLGGIPFGFHHALPFCCDCKLYWIVDGWVRTTCVKVVIIEATTGGEAWVRMAVIEATACGLAWNWVAYRPSPSSQASRYNRRHGGGSGVLSE